MFIQNRFIDGKAGQKFIFDDDIILNLINSTQSFKIEPEEDMLIKMSSKEAYGVNMEMKLCQDENNCEARSSKTGNTEILFAEVKAGKSYRIHLDFSHSIVSLSSFYDCPHARVSIAMTKVSVAEGIIKAQQDMSSSDL